MYNSHPVRCDTTQSLTDLYLGPPLLGVKIVRYCETQRKAPGFAASNAFEGAM